MRRLNRIGAIFTEMNLIDLCGGIGGFSLAGHWLGWKTVTFVEKDPFCQKVLSKNFLGVPIHNDIYTFSAKPFRGRCDIVTAGFPCQPFSQAGQRRGSNDERYLFPEVLRIIAEAQPTWVLLENVDGLVTMANDTRLVGLERKRSFRSSDTDYYEALYTFEETMLLEVICQQIENQGYEVQPVVIPVSAVGANHERYRVFIIAHANDERRFGRSKQGQDGKRQVRQGRRNDRPFGESSANHSAIAGTSSDSDSAQKHGANSQCQRFSQQQGRTVETRRKTLRPENGKTNSDEFSGRDSITSDADGQRPRRKSEDLRNGKHESVGENRIDFNSDADPKRQQQSQRLERDFGRRTDDSDKSIYSDADRERLQRRQFDDGSERTQSDDEQSFGRNRNWSENWLEVALRTCVRDVDDGIPGRLVRPKGWRGNALKAGGNSVSPVLVYEIFKAIEYAENQK